MSEPPSYRLRRRAVPPVAAPVLDAAQQAVVDHRDGPLLVLAGPGTGKTTTLVECVARRVAEGLAPESVLVLTFSRKAAGELRERISARLGLTTGGATAWTFHAFCYALVRAQASEPAYLRPLRLLSGPESDVAVHELLVGHALGEGRGAWPEALRAGLRTRGFAAEVRAVLARAREVGLEPPDLAERARAAGRGDWAAVAAFHEEYLDVLGDLGAVDHSELVHQAGLLLRRPEVVADLRERYAAVLVDEYQDTDPSQEALLRAVAGDGRDLVVVGDPDQSVYAFRGADVGALLRFPDRFPQRDGARARVEVLTTSRRAGSALLAASRSVTARLPLSGLPADAARAHRRLAPAPDTPPGSVLVETHPSAGAEVEAVADRLRRAHLEEGVPWSRMAVVVRSGVRSIPLLRRVLTAAGVPLEVAGDELPLAAEPAVAPLLLALRCADAPAQLTAERARTLLLSPLGGADAGDLRRLGRVLRARDAEAAAAAALQAGALPAPRRPSAELLREAVDPTTSGDPLGGVDPDTARPAAGLRRLLTRARAVLTEGGTPEDALWSLWSATRWRDRLAAASAAGGPEGRAADRDLDAVVALFEAAARAEEETVHRGVANLLAELEAQAIPGDTLAERGVAGEAVRLLTAHRSKGLEWDVVVVCGVQEGVWPDLRRRGTVLEPDRLGRDGLVAPLDRSALLAEERRLFYVAVTRARAALLVTAVDSPEEDGERPSRFLAELGVGVREVRERVARPLTLTGLVAELRCTLVDPAAPPALRDAAAARLAVLAAATTVDGDPVAPAADPDRWWGLLASSEAPEPVHRAGAPLRLSGTSLSGLGECPLRWFLGHEVHADTPPSAAMGFGGLLHALADSVARGSTPADLPALEQRLDRVWGRLAYEAPWVSAQQREAAREALSRFLNWHLGGRGRELVATEVEFEVPLPVAGPDGPAEVVLRGSMDRVERAADGRLHVADLKTGKTPPSKGEVASHPQLGLYQLAVQAGALDAVAGPGAVPGGAELVLLRTDGPKKGPAGHPLSREQAALEPGGGWVADLLADAVARLLAEDFPATPNDRCERCPFRRCCPAQPDGRQVVA